VLILTLVILVLGLVKTTVTLQDEIKSLSRSLQASTAKVKRYERLLDSMSQGQFDPEQGVLVEFEEIWYGTPIFRYTFNTGRKPGDLWADIEEDGL
jgi:hypothetical protein